MQIIAPRRRLALAFVLSLVLHLAVLSTLRGGRSGTPLQDVLQVTLVSPSVSQMQAVPHVASPVPAPAPPPAPAAPVPAPERMAPASEPAASPVATAPQTGAVQGEGSRADRPARPLSWPLVDPDVRRQLVARRLQLRVQVEADGSVSRAEFRNHELSPAALHALEEAVSRVKFEPAARDGKPASVLLDTRLCFDDEGEFEQRSPQCWAFTPR